jgi:hypothetical protein
MADTIIDDTQQWYPEVDEDQKDLVEKQERDVVASLPIVQEVLDWFDQQIKTYKNPLTIEGVNPSTPAEDVKASVLLAQTLITDYKRQREDFQASFSRYITEVADGGA